MKINTEDLKSLIKKTLTSTYYSDSEAEQIAEVLIYAEMAGKNTQGVLKLVGAEPIQSVKPKYPAKTIKETKLSALIDGSGNPGILIANMATDLAIRKCKENGFGIVGTNNTFSSTGVIGFYVNKITQNDFVGIVMSSSPGSVAPYGSIEALFGTNPLAVGFPTTEDPIIFDMATSAITFYGLIRAKALGEKLPEGVAMDKDGNLTTDPEKAIEGAILPFDKSYKGSGLGMMVEILAGPLVGADFADTNPGKGWGNLFIAIDPDLLIGKEEFKETCSELINMLKSSKTDPKVGKIRIPGEESLKNKKQVEKIGELEIEDKLLQELTSLQNG